MRPVMGCFPDAAGVIAVDRARSLALHVAIGGLGARRFRSADRDQQFQAVNLGSCVGATARCSTKLRAH